MNALAPRTAAPPRIVDATLREGMQAAGVRFGTRESTEIARAVVAIGVDMVECGHPRVGDAETGRVRAVVEACGAVPVLAHARARVDDVESVERAGAKWVGIFVPIDERAKSSRLRPGCSVSEMIRDSVTHAKSIGLGVRFSAEDASRTPISELIDAFGTALEAGADRICIADTVGVLCPWDVEALIRALVDGLADPEIEVHFHNDRGLAAANALTAVRAGARWVSSSVNGIGERCGITDTIILLANLAALGLRVPPDGAALQRCSAIVQTHSRLFVDRSRPIVGRNAFTHVAKLHRTAMAKDERSYSWTDPAVLGRVTELGPESFPEGVERLIHRGSGVPPGDRRVMLDDRIVEDARQCCIVEHVRPSPQEDRGHLAPQRHSVDSLFLFLTGAEDLAGLDVEVSLADRTFRVESPASVFVPAGVEHGYRVVSGSGLIVHHVLAGTYESSLPALPVSAKT
jgi:2-isopropylmalate synthase